MLSRSVLRSFQVFVYFPVACFVIDLLSDSLAVGKHTAHAFDSFENFQGLGRYYNASAILYVTSTHRSRENPCTQTQ